MFPRYPTALLVVGVLLGVTSCRTAGEHRLDADREVYEILKERLEQLGAGGSFTIDPPENSLRSRVLAGEFGEEGPPPFDLEACLLIAAESNRSYQDRRETLYGAALSLTMERWDFSVQETGSFGAFLSGDGTEAQSTGVFSALGISRLLGLGTRIVGDATIDLARDVSRADAWGAVSNLSLNVTQPLLRGFGRDIVREPLTQAERNVLYAARTYERFRRTFTFDVASRYYRLLESYDRLDNENANLDRIIELRMRNEAMAEAGRVSDMDVGEAHQDELSGETRVLEAERSLEASLDDFKLFLGLPIETHIVLDLEGDEPLVSTEVLEFDVVEEEAVAVALAERLDHLTIVDRVADAERSLHIATDNLRAGLGISASVGATSEENNLADYRRRNMDWQLGLDLDMPWDQLPERNSYRSALISLDQAVRSAEESADTIRADLRDAIRTIETAQTTLEIEEGAVELARRRVESTQLSLEAGRADTRQVLDAQNSLIQAENSLIRARTDHTLAGLTLYRDMELLRIEEGGIRIDMAPLEDIRNGQQP